MTIIARQDIPGLLEPVIVGGVTICVGTFALWAIHPFSWWVLFLSGWFWLGGLFFIFTGIKCWHPNGIGLILDRQGLWWKYDQLVLVPWDDIAGVKLVCWTSEGEEMQGLLVGLKDEATAPIAPSVLSFFSNYLKKEFGPLPWQKVIMLYDEQWHWDPKDALSQLEGSIADPTMRERW
jgi:hypothetical protein